MYNMRSLDVYAATTATVGKVLCMWSLEKGALLIRASECAARLCRNSLHGKMYKKKKRGSKKLFTQQLASCFASGPLPTFDGSQLWRIKMIDLRQQVGGRFQKRWRWSSVKVALGLYTDSKLEKWIPHTQTELILHIHIYSSAAVLLLASMGILQHGLVSVAF